MPTTTHEAFVTKITRLIDTKIDELARPGSRVSELLATVESRGSAAFRTVNIQLDKAVHLRRPRDLQSDACWGRMGDHYPGLTVEVAYTQTSMELVEKINKIIGYSGGCVRCVIAIDLGCPGPSANVQVWRSHIEKPGDPDSLLRPEVFRQPDVSIQRLDHALPDLDQLSPRRRSACSAL
jgi:hypothetical protein